MKNRIKVCLLLMVLTFLSMGIAAKAESRAFPSASPAIRAGSPAFSEFAAGLPGGLQGDFQKQYDELKAKLEGEFNQPPDLAPFPEYLSWMQIKAEDRDKANALAASAQNAGNPYWFERFQDLAEYAQESGKSTVAGAVMQYVHPRDLSNWLDATHRAREYGKPLYTRAVELSLDPNNVREAVRCNMRYSLAMVEGNSSNSMCLYHDRSFIHGHDYDAEGNLYLPNMNFDITCLPRSAFQLDDPGDPVAPADVGLAWVEQIREICEWFKLFEFNEATELMEQYLMEKDEDYLGSGAEFEVLCMLPRGKGHAFFLDLAESYNLPKAREYIEGFYATLKGLVEYEDEDGKREPAPGAVVTVTDPYDGTEWIVEADEDGNYEIEEVILHKTCGPFPITAEYRGYKEEDEYEGPLEDPDKDYEHEKNLVVRADAWEGMIGYTWAMAAGVNESVLAALTPGGKYDITTNWRLRLKFKRDRGNENVAVYALDRAVLETFDEKFDSTGWDMKSRAGSSLLESKETAQARRRTLSRKECDLELVINFKKKTYTINGDIEVEGVAIEGGSLMDTRVGPIRNRRRESSEGSTGIDEEIDIDGTFTGEKPERLAGSRNEMEKVPPDFQKFFQDLAGKIDWKITWSLKKRKRD